jgi:diamine N-acetyltransferase
LRAVEPSDADVLYRWENDLSLWHASGMLTPLSRAVIDEFVNSAHQDIYTNKQLRLIACSVSNSEVLAIVDLFDFDPQNNRCGVGILVNSKARNNGVGFECLDLVTRYAFETLLLKQVYADIADSNTASINLFEKCGFEKIALKKCWKKTALDNYEDVWFLQRINGKA